jgi:hypothetical protein
MESLPQIEGCLQNKIQEIIRLSEQAKKTNESRFGNINSTRLLTDEMFWEGLEQPSLPELSLDKMLSTLSKEEVVSVMTLMWVGREYDDGDFNNRIKLLENMYLEAKRSVCSDGSHIPYISGKYPVLSRYLKLGFIIWQETQTKVNEVL